MPTFQKIENEYFSFIQAYYWTLNTISNMSSKYIDLGLFFVYVENFQQVSAIRLCVIWRYITKCFSVISAWFAVNSSEN
jgi:hypothetical protein